MPTRESARGDAEALAYTLRCASSSTAEQRTLNPQVRGSNPRRRTSKPLSVPTSAESKHRSWSRCPDRRTACQGRSIRPNFPVASSGPGPKIAGVPGVSPTTVADSSSDCWKVVISDQRAVLVRSDETRLSGGGPPTMPERFDKAAKLMDDAKDEVLAVSSFPRAHWRQIWFTNPLERLNTDSSDAVGSSASSPTRPPSCASPVRCSSTCTRSGPLPNVALLRGLDGQAPSRAR